MPFPNYEGKHALQPVFSASDSVENRRRAGKQSLSIAPPAAIVCFQPSLRDWIAKKYTIKPTDAPFLSILHCPDGADIGIVEGFGFGAPSAVSALERVIVMGAERIVIVGLAGALQKHQQIGDIVICDRAIRDEGTSYHYVSPAKYALPSKSLTELLTDELGRGKRPYTVGTTWTTDAPYRETREEILQYQAEGVLTVEMEASAVFALGTVHRTHAAAAFVISDTLGDLSWNAQFHSKLTKNSLRSLFSAVLGALENG